MAQSSRRHRINDNRLILEILVLVFVVIFIFEGRFIYIMFTFHPSEDETAKQESVQEAEVPAEGEAEGTSDFSASYLAGISDATDQSYAKGSHPTVSNPESFAIVPRQKVAVDDSYFSDAAFIGDSRMEGFRNASGITQGTFFTSVGMALESMASSPIITTNSGSVTVAAALSGNTYGKIYLMLGANDLGTYDWEEFREGLLDVLANFREIQPDAIIYVCSCIYVEEEKVTTGDYVNNTNVDTLNDILLEVCEEGGYYYLNLNEAFSDGNGALIAGASADGVHLNTEYCEEMLDYMKTHYIPVDTEEETEAASESETEPEKKKS